MANLLHGGKAKPGEIPGEIATTSSLEMDRLGQTGARNLSNLYNGWVNFKCLILSYLHAT